MANTTNGQPCNTCRKYKRVWRDLKVVKVHECKACYEKRTGRKVKDFFK